MQLPRRTRGNDFVCRTHDLDQRAGRKLDESGFRDQPLHIQATLRIPHRLYFSAGSRYVIQPKRRQIRTVKNKDVSFIARTPVLDEARYDLYRRYIEVRHADGDMYPPSPSQYESFLTSTSDHAFSLKRASRTVSSRSHYSTKFAGRTLSNLLILRSGPQFDSRSLGRLMVHSSSKSPVVSGFLTSI